MCELHLVEFAVGPRVERNPGSAGGILLDNNRSEALLETLGVTKPPNGAVRRFTAFRKVLAAIQAENMRVVVVVEDAVRTGLDTLAELEALQHELAAAAPGSNEN